MKEHKFDNNSFIGGWYIDEKICDDIIKYFKDNSHLTFNGSVGSLKQEGFYQDKKVKESKEMLVQPNRWDIPFKRYRESLQKCLLKYIDKYYVVNQLDKFDIREDINIQYYKKNQGYKTWHYENDGFQNRQKRVLVFMTYLNNVEDGGTEFHFQNTTTPAKKGLTLIWPAYFTHTHRGQISKTKEKYIITGWYSNEN